jgi:hypothetical protein
MRILGIIAATLALGTPAMAAGPALQVGAGIGGSTLQGSLPEIDNSLGGRFRLNFSFPVAPEIEQLRLGIGFSIEGATETGPRTDGGGSFFKRRPYSSFVAFSPEISIAWSQPLGDRWFIEPQAALVMPIAHYSIGSEHYNDYYDDTHFHQSDGWTKVGIGVRPSLAVGFNFNDHHAIGVEFAYLFSTIDLGDGIGPDYHAFDVGIFYRLTF